MGRIEFRDIGDDHDYTLNMIWCGLFLEVKHVYNTVSAEPFKVSVLHTSFPFYGFEA